MVLSNSVADPGFLRGGGANSPGGGTYEFAKFSQELHATERIWTGGGRVPCGPLDPPLQLTLRNEALSIPKTCRCRPPTWYQRIIELDLNLVQW